ncbi:hypothetical protein J4H86_14195 [Spiractinospora alimapuensis]|uniref:SLAC1 family transporter n=1 Tax=Spiractinospora alimapuensis TaxID=2820884 RepID=UPI001F246B6C|nr:hypothetical protein [Spiractinospora alimapuensis]QVQ50115.1 hypothetical protein J4H86_14195 [Spiractinospora alimapuensis]
MGDVPGGTRGRAVAEVRAVTPASGAEVMGTGIISIGLHLVGVEWLSLVLLVVAAALWVGLASVFAVRLGRDWEKWLRDAVTPAALTGVAGTAVLGVRVVMLGWLPVGAVMLALAAVLWVPVLVLVLGHLRRALPGAAYLVCVSTQSVVVLAAALATARGTPWVLWPGIAVFLLGLVLYVWVLQRFDFAQLRVGAGDHWVAGGATAISALAAARLTGVAWGAQRVDYWGAVPAHAVLAGFTWAMVAVALAWYLVLVACEIRWPRLRYNVRRWSTVFPLGMTAVACMIAGSVLGFPLLSLVGAVLVWPALVVWAVVGVGALRHVVGRIRVGSGAHPQHA